jgi:hypothetical protein
VACSNCATLTRCRCNSLVDINKNYGFPDNLVAQSNYVLTINNKRLKNNCGPAECFIEWCCVSTYRPQYQLIFVRTLARVLWCLHFSFTSVLVNIYSNPYFCSYVQLSDAGKVSMSRPMCFCAVRYLTRRLLDVSAVIFSLTITKIFVNENRTFSLTKTKTETKTALKAKTK